MNENHQRRSYLIPGADDASKKHEEVAHGDQAGPDDQGEDAQELFEDRFNADQDKDAEEDGKRSGNGDHKGDVSLDILKQKHKTEGHEESLFLMAS